MRHAVVLALTGHETPLAIESLILLTNAWAIPTTILVERHSLVWQCEKMSG